jgi:hypothetical protein
MEIIVGVIRTEEPAANTIIRKPFIFNTTLWDVSVVHTIGQMLIYTATGYIKDSKQLLVLLIGLWASGWVIGTEAPAMLGKDTYQM